MSRELEKLIEMARKYRNENRLDEAERNRQVRSFAFGNANLENEAITKADIDQAMDSLQMERAHTAVCS